MPARPRIPLHPRLLGAIGALTLVLVATSALVLRGASASRAAAPALTPSQVAVYVYPVPGDRVAAPATQISFRGLPAAELGTITVTGSKSGVHTGRIASDSDAGGASFIPAKPFTAGENVTVGTALNVVGAQSGSFSFTVATPAHRVPGTTPIGAPRVKGDVARFASVPGLAPATVNITKAPSHSQPGYIFLAPQGGPVQRGPMILGPYGGLIWFDPLPKNDTATDFRVQTYKGKPVLSWWQGNVSASGTGAGVDEILDGSYHHLATVEAGNGLSADLHEFQITSASTALITSYYPVIWDARAVKGGSSKQIVLDSVVQEIDIPTGLVLFQWDSLNSVPVTDSYAPIPKPSSHPYDYFHVNSVEQGPDGNLIVSSRDTWTIYKLDARTGATLWELNGKHSSFKMGSGTAFAFQHDARLLANGELTLFDDGAGPPVVHKQSRGLTLALDTTHMRATLARQDEHKPALLAAYEGNDQRLANGDQFLGWGQQPFFTEFNSGGGTVFDGRFVGANSSYRAYRFSWTGTPTTRPSVAARSHGSTTTVYASWNGATSVARWKVFSGASASTVKATASGARTDFESKITIRSGAGYVAVQALDRHGRVLGSSTSVRVR